MIACAACSAPKLRFAPKPDDSIVFVDGVRRAKLEKPIDLPYYGTIAVSTVPADSLDSFGRLRTARGSVRVEEPVSPWLFPFDFFLEVGRAALGELDDEIVVSVAPEPRDDVVVVGVRPPRTEELRYRAREMSTQR